MKYFKTLFILIIFSNILNAELVENVVLFDAKNICITNDYYVKNSKLNYYDISADTWNRTKTKDYQNTFIYDYIYDTETKECYAKNETNFQKYKNIVLGFLVSIIIIWSLI